MVLFKRNDLAERWGISLSTLQKRPDSQMPARFKLPGSRLWMCREEDLLAFETGCVVQPSNDDDTRPPAQKTENKNMRGRPTKPPVSDRGRRPSGKPEE